MQTNSYNIILRLTLCTSLQNFSHGLKSVTILEAKCRETNLINVFNLIA